MTTIEEHLKIIRELEEDLEEKIREDKLACRQKIVGFIISESAVNLFAVFLYKNELVSPGHNVNHRVFRSVQKAEEKYPAEFRNKDILFSYLQKIESYRSLLCYGKDKKAEDVEKAVSIYYEFKKIIEGKNDV